MSAGRLIAAVGPSGVGKDSVMSALASRAPALQLVRRCITRAPELGGEDYTPLTAAEFDAAAARGDFCVHWGAHDLRYGIPAQVLRDVQSGAECLVNFSRGALGAAAEIFPAITVLNITASPETLAARLAARGRESGAAVQKRLARVGAPIPDALPQVTIANDGALEDTVTAALRALSLSETVS
jgi:ribose 1,5-bisphosphokinase